jgi:hypothetical protein
MATPQATEVLYILIVDKAPSFASAKIQKMQLKNGYADNRL